MFYFKRKIPQVSGNVHWAGIQFDSGVYPICCLTKDEGTLDPPISTSYKRHTHKVIKGNCNITLPSSFCNTGLTLEFLENIYGKFTATEKVSRVEPHAATGLVTNRIKGIQVLLANLIKNEITVKVGQVVGDLKFAG